jgi:hypothetical protein
VAPVLISGRQATTVLFQAGLTRRQARRVLDTGLAGSPHRTAGSHLYDADRVVGFAARPWLTETEVDLLFPRELFIARRDIDVSAPEDVQLSAVRDNWDLSPWSRVLLRVRCAEHGFVPLVVTVGGFVVLGAEITDVFVAAPRRAVLALRAPGDWFEPVRGIRLSSGPGRDFVVRGWNRPGPAPTVGSPRPPVGESLPYPTPEETA